MQPKTEISHFLQKHKPWCLLAFKVFVFVRAAELTAGWMTHCSQEVKGQHAFVAKVWLILSLALMLRLLSHCRVPHQQPKAVTL